MEKMTWKKTEKAQSYVMSLGIIGSRCSSKKKNKNKIESHTDTHLHIVRNVHAIPRENSQRQSRHNAAAEEEVKR